MFRSMKTQDRKRGPYAKSAQRRRQIIEAAFDVFAARGYQGGSLQEVADRVGLGHTSILHYFPSKRALLIAVLEQRDAVAKPQPSEAPQGLVEVVLAQAMHNQAIPGLIELYTVLCGEAVTEGYPARDYFVDRFSRLRASYARRLRELEARGRLRPGVDVDRAAASLVALWDGIQAQWLLDRDTVDVVGCLGDFLNGIIVPAEHSAVGAAAGSESRTAPEG